MMAPPSGYRLRACPHLLVRNSPMTEDEFDQLVDDATHAVNNLIPDLYLDGMGDTAHSGVLYAINDALSTILRSEEHTSELQSLMRISYAVLCLTKQQITSNKTQHDQCKLEINATI